MRHKRCRRAPSKTPILRDDVLSCRVIRTASGWWHLKIWIAGDGGTVRIEEHQALTPVEVGFLMKQYPVEHPVAMRGHALRWGSRHLSMEHEWLW